MPCGLPLKWLMTCSRSECALLIAAAHRVDTPRHSEPISLPQLCSVRLGRCDGNLVMHSNERFTAEDQRLAEDAARKKNWKRWGPYLAERQWGTVREDYSPDGMCWDYFPHDHARSRAYRWG